MGRLLRYLRALVDLLFGYDFFISYAHDDGYYYPRELTNQLEQKGFKVFLDSREYVPGDDLQIATRRRIRMSKKLVVIARPAALQSQWVLKEVQTSLQSRRVPIVIDINATIAGAGETNAVKILLEDKLHIRETIKTLDDNPSQETLSQLSRSFCATRQETSRLRFVTAVAIFSFLLASAAIWQYMAAEDARIQAEQQRDLAQGRELAAQSLAEGASDPELGVLLALESMHVAPTAQGDQALRTLLPDLYAKSILTGEDLSVLSTHFNASGDRIIIAGGDQIARIYETDSGRLLRELKGHKSIISDARFSPDGKKVVTSSQDATARVWDIQTGKVLATLGHKHWVYAAQFSSDNSRVMTFEQVSNKQVRSYFWNVTTGEKIHPIDGFDSYASDNDRWLISIEGNHLVLRDTHDGEVSAQINTLPGTWIPGGLSGDGKMLALGSSANNVEVWDFANDKMIRQLDGHDEEVTAVAFSPDNRWLATASCDFTAKLWPLSNKGEPFTLRGHTDQVTSVAFSPDGRWVATASADKTARLWDALSGRLVAQIRGHKSKVVSIAFHPQLPLLLTSADNTVRLSRVADGQAIRRFASKKNPYIRAALSPNSSLIIATGIDHTDLWGARTEVPISKIDGGSFIPVDVDFHPQGQFFAMAGFDGKIRIGDALRDRIVSTLSGHDKPLFVVRFDPTGDLLVSAGEDGTAKLWKRGKTKPLLTYRGHNNTVKEAAFSPDGKTVATGDYDRQIHFWSAATGKLLSEPVTFPKKILRILFHPTDDLLLVAMVDGPVLLWSPSSQTRRVLDHSKGFSGATFTPDGKYLMTGDQQNHLTLWDVKTAEQVSTFNIAYGSLSFADLSDDGKWLLTIEADKAVRLYPWELLAPTSDLIDIAKQRLTRSLTAKERSEFGSTEAVLAE